MISWSFSRKDGSAMEWLGLAPIAPMLISSVFAFRLGPVAQRGPSFSLLRGAVKASSASIDVVIPAYNEVVHIEACVRSVLDSSSMETLTVWVVDDKSSDETGDILARMDKEGDRRLRVIRGVNQPANEGWIGKNWACAQAIDRATGEFVLFIDADVRLRPGAIEAAIEAMAQNQWDLLTGWLEIQCGC